MPHYHSEQVKVFGGFYTIRETIPRLPSKDSETFGSKSNMIMLWDTQVQFIFSCTSLLNIVTRGNFTSFWYCKKYFINYTTVLNVTYLLSACKYWKLTSTEKKEQPTKISYNTISTMISTVMVWMKNENETGCDLFFYELPSKPGSLTKSFHQFCSLKFWKMILTLPQHLTSLKLNITFN